MQMPIFLFQYLKRKLGAHKAERVFILWHRFGAFAFAASVVILASVVFVSLYDPEKFQPKEITEARVLFTYAESSEDIPFRMTAAVQLPDGSQITVVTRQYEIAFGTVDMICLRRLVSESGRTKYRWVAKRLCKQ